MSSGRVSTNHEIIVGQVWLDLTGMSRLIVWRNRRWVTMVELKRQDYALPDVYPLATVRHWKLIREPNPIHIETLMTPGER